MTRVGSKMSRGESLFNSSTDPLLKFENIESKTIRQKIREIKNEEREEHEKDRTISCAFPASERSQ